MKDDTIIELYFKRDESAIIETQKKYDRLCKTIIERILYCNEDVEECLSDVYMELWEIIPPNKPESLPAFIAILARNKACNKLRYNKALKRSQRYIEIVTELDEVIDPKYKYKSQYDDLELSNVIVNFLRKQSYTDRYVLMRRYWFQDTLEEIAIQCKKSSGWVNTRLYRLRKKLKRHLIDFF